MTDTKTLSLDELQPLIAAAVEDLERRKKTGCKSFHSSGSIRERTHGPGFGEARKLSGTLKSFAARLDALA